MLYLGRGKETESTDGFERIMGTPTGRMRLILTSALLYAAPATTAAGRWSG